MFANSYQSGFISIFYSVGNNPLAIWDKQVKNGHIRRIIDDEVKSLVLEVAGTNVATTFITCPQDPKQTLGIKLPFLVMIIKNTKKYFSFEIQIKDDKDMHRRFRVSNFQSTTKVYPFCTTMPIGLSEGWNQVQFNLADFTKRAYGSVYLETTRVQIHANVRIRRIYFSDTLYSEEQMPNEFRLYKPTNDEPKKSTSSSRQRLKGVASADGKAEAASEVPPPPSPVETPGRPEGEEGEQSEPEGQESTKGPSDQVESGDEGEYFEGPSEMESPPAGAEDAAAAGEEKPEAGEQGEAPEGEEAPATEGEEPPSEATEAGEAAPAEEVPAEAAPEEAAAEAPPAEEPPAAEEAPAAESAAEAAPVEAAAEEAPAPE